MVSLGRSRFSTRQNSPYSANSFRVQLLKPEEATVFFGRERQVDALVARMRDPDQRFVVVVGASGIGKSSLIRAGLLPKLENDAIKGSRAWRVLPFAPGFVSKTDPFTALAVEPDRQLPPAYAGNPADIADELAAAPQCLSRYANMLLADRPDSAAVVLFIDQFEELFAHGRRP